MKEAENIVSLQVLKSWQTSSSKIDLHDKPPSADNNGDDDTSDDDNNGHTC